MTLTQDLAYSRQPQTRGPTVFSMRDLIDRLMLFSSAGATTQQQPDWKIAADEAYRAVCYGKGSSWKCLQKHYEIATVAPYQTGTVQYTQSTRTLTLTDGTWPSWALFGHVAINQTFYEVETVTDPTNLVLALRANPGQDIAAGQAYVLYRSSYTLPPDFQKMYSFQNQQILWSGRYCTPPEWYRLERHVPTAATPYLWTVMHDPRLIGSMAVFLWPYAPDVQTFGGIYEGAFRPMRITGYAAADYTGTVSCSASATVTGSGTSFGQQHVGSIFRISNVATNPDGGTAYPDGPGGTNPAAEDAIVQAVASTTGLTLDRALTGTYSGKPFTISDAVDVPEWMLPAILARCRFEYIKNRPATGTSVQTYKALADEAFIIATQADSSIIPGAQGPWGLDRMQRDVDPNNPGWPPLP